MNIFTLKYIKNLLFCSFLKGSINSKVFQADTKEKQIETKSSEGSGLSVLSKSINNPF